MTRAFLAVSSLVCLLAVGCSKSSESGPGAAPGGSAAPAAAGGGDVPCDKVVEKIASLNPADMRGPAEKKMWGAMCASMSATEKTCVLGAKDMAGMKDCVKNKK